MNLSPIKIISLIGLLVLASLKPVTGQIYLHDFGLTDILSKPYTDLPPTLASNLSNSSWTTSSTGWSGLPGSSGESLSLSNSSGTPTYTLTIDVASGYKVDITHFNFWRVRSTTGAQNWALTINGITVGSGSIPTTGASIGSTAVSAAITGLTGTITVVMTLSGASGSGTFRLDDFALFGSVSSTATPSIAISANHPVASNIYQNSSNQVLGCYVMAVSSSNASINSISVTTSGTYQGADLVTNSFKLFYTSSNLFSSNIQLGSGQAIVSSGNSITFSGLTQTINSGSIGYFWITADIAVNAVVGRTIAVAAANFSQFTFSSGAKTGADPVPAGNLQTFVPVVQAGDVIINQFSPDYGGATDEYIELVNKTAYSIDLSTLKIQYRSASGTGTYSNILSGILQPYSFWLLSTNASVTVGQTIDLSRDGSLASGFATGGQIAIMRVSDNALIDGVAYGGAVSTNLYGEGAQVGALPTDGGIKRLIDGADLNVNNTDFTTIINGSIYLRNSYSRLGISGSNIGPGSFTDLIITGNTLLNGTVNITNRVIIVTGTLTTGGNLILKSTASKTACVSAIGSGGSIVGNLTVERFIPAQRKFRFLASPVVGATAAHWRDNGGSTAGIGTHITGSGGASNNFDNSNTNAPSAFTYTEANGDVIHTSIGGSNNAGWTAFGSGMQALTNGLGFRVMVRGDRTLSLNSTPAPAANTTTLSVTGSYPNSPVIINVTRAADVAGKGWNLVGNPYPSSISWNAISKSIEVANTYQTFNPSTNAYVTWNGTIGDATDYISSGQGFLVFVSSGSNYTNGSITIEEADKVTNNGGSFFKTELKNLLKISMKYDTNNINNTFIHFRDHATAFFDPAYDAPKLNNPGVNLASKDEQSNYYSINSLPLSALNETKVIPLSVLNSVEATYTLGFEDVNSFDGQEIYLEDKYTHTTSLITEGMNYSFTLSSDKSSSNDGRFNLIFSKKSTGLSKQSEANSFMLFPNPTSERINISLLNTNRGEYTYDIYNQLGAQIKAGNLNFTANSAQSIGLEELSNGVYYIKIYNATSTQTIKFIK